jgi:hypothetical protein
MTAHFPAMRASSVYRRNYLSYEEYSMTLSVMEETDRRR